MLETTRATKQRLTPERISDGRFVFGFRGLCALGECLPAPGSGRGAGKS
jgi:hypothetical protein